MEPLVILNRRLITEKAGNIPDIPVSKTNLRFGDTQFAVPMRLALTSKPDDIFTLPIDPVVSISSSNIITKREIAKSEIRGTVKELWTQADWSVSISGILQADPNRDKDQYVGSLEYYVQKLFELVTAQEALIVECDTLNNTFDITRLVVESYDFPFTKGIDSQSFTLSCISDESYDLNVM